MDLTSHEGFTEEVLSDVDLGLEAVNEILSGSVANDLCALTNEYKWIMSVTEYFKKKRKKALLDYSSFYQSHWGKLSALHCMANDNGEPPIKTRQNVINWMKLLDEAYHNDDEEWLKRDLHLFTDTMGDTVAGLEFSLSDILDTDDIQKAKYRAIGMMLHIIHDSFTQSHCRRSSDGSEMEAFFCYTGQDPQKHSKGDKIMTGCDDRLLNMTRTVLTSLIENQDVDYGELIKLSDNAQPSGHGGYA
jgi:hypothetical protein